MFKFFSIVLLFAVNLLRFAYSTPVIVSPGPENDYEGWIARLSDSRLMVVFCRNPDWASGDLFVTFSTDGGNNWNAVQPIIVENGDQATLSYIQMPDDTIWLWYASNEDGQYGIFAAYSLDALAWNRQGRINLGWTTTTMYYDPTVILESDSSLTMSYRGPSGAYIANKPRGGDWDTLRTLVGSGGYRPRIMKHTNGTYLYTYHRNIGGGQYEVFVRTSNDRVNWSAETRLTFQGNSHDPFANQMPDGAYMVYYATYQAPAYNLWRCRSYDAVNWEPQEQVTSDATNNTQPHFFTEGNDVFLLWAHCVSYPYDHDVYFERTPYLQLTEHNEYLMKNNLILSPNPCRNYLDLQFQSICNANLDITLYDISGKQIATWKFDCIVDCHLDVDNLTPGTYFLKINYGPKKEFRQFIKIE